MAEVRERRDKNAPLAPVFFEARSFQDAELACKEFGVEGTVLRFLPNEQEVLKISMAIISGLPQRPLRQSSYKIGVLAHQGDYRLHIRELLGIIPKINASSAVDVMLVRDVDDLAQANALVMPGGWSTIQSVLLQESNLFQAIRDFKESGNPILAVCAGMILAGRKPGYACKGRDLLDLIDVKIYNNVLNGPIETRLCKSDEVIQPVFSNGPLACCLGPNVQPLAVLSDETLEQIKKRLRGQEGFNEADLKKTCVAAREGNVFIFAYHEGESLHKQFIEYCLGFTS